ncbi:hypothetical protein PTKIN_Ptkin16aG0514200 [Pterospermum kingtungense]
MLNPAQRALQPARAARLTLTQTTGWATLTQTGWAFDADLIATETAFVLKAELPGLRREEVTLEVEDGRTLHIKGEKKRHGKETSLFLRERKFGKFSRKIILSANVDVEAVTANMENGVLTVTLPKATNHDIRVIPISH